MAVERFRRVTSALSIRLSVHVNGDPLTYVVNGAHTIDALLHLPVSTVASFHRVGRRRQQRIIEEGQRLLDVGREELLDCCSDGSEGPFDSATQSGEFLQRCLRTAAAVEKAIDFVHNGT
jgi:hypothetical protein